jgi:hypothetical protein
MTIDFIIIQKLITPCQSGEIDLLRLVLLFAFFILFVAAAAKDILAFAKNTPFYARNTRLFEEFALPFVVMLACPPHFKL